MHIGPELSYEAIKVEIAFQHQNYFKAVKKPIFRYYNTAYLCKQMLVVFIGTLFYTAGRTIYALLIVIDVLWVVATALALPSFHKCNGYMILASDVLQFWKHLPQLVFTVDSVSGYFIGQATTNSWSVIGVLAWFFGILIEFILIFMGRRESDPGPTENLNQEEIKLDVGSEDELKRKMDNYKLVKTGKAPSQATSNLNATPKASILTKPNVSTTGNA